ncbi:MAG: PilZ domain-containing protein [Bryobacterales bacterium]|nr:PilZ domain-containing protein [Bryobacterales bacterium]
MEQRKQIRVPVQRPVKLTVLGDNPTEMEGYLSNISGRGLRMTMSEAIPVNAAVRVDIDNSMLLGEVCYCEPFGGQWAVGLEMEQSLSDLSGLCRLVERLMMEEKRNDKAAPVDNAKTR